MSLDTLLLIDAYSLIYRAFYAIRELTAPDGQPVNAIFGFTKMVRKLLADFDPSHVAIVYDLGAPTARLELLPSYKENRPPTPPALDAQLERIREAVAGLGLAIVEREGEEADDLIATLARQAAQDGARVLIATNDKDLAQVVDDRIHLLRPDGKQTAEVHADDVRERYGVTPQQIVDYLSMIGDTVDDIPGVPGIGPKTASELLARYGSLEDILRHAQELTRPKLREALVTHGANAQRNRQLIQLRTALKLPVTWRELTRREPDPDRLRALYQACGFKTLLTDLEKQSAPATRDLFGTA